MKALHRMDRYRKEVLQLSTWKHGINVQYLYDKIPNDNTFLKTANGKGGNVECFKKVDVKIPKRDGWVYGSFFRGME